MERVKGKLSLNLIDLFFLYFSILLQRFFCKTEKILRNVSESTSLENNLDLFFFEKILSLRFVLLLCYEIEVLLYYKYYKRYKFKIRLFNINGALFYFIYILLFVN